VARLITKDVKVVATGEKVVSAETVATVKAVTGKEAAHQTVAVVSVTSQANAAKTVLLTTVNVAGDFKLVN
jgi:hypothetical protein